MGHSLRGVFASIIQTWIFPPFRLLSVSTRLLPPSKDHMSVLKAEVKLHRATDVRQWMEGCVGRLGIRSDMVLPSAGSCKKV